MAVRVLIGALAFLCLAAAAARADDVVDSFYARCVNENAYQMQPAELDEACACMAPVLVSFLKPDARKQVEDAIRNNRQVTFQGSPYQGNPSDNARTAIQTCPMVGAAMYQQRCAGGNEQAPECQEMKAMIQQSQ